MAELDYEKLPVNRDGSNVTVWIGPTGANGALGVDNVYEPEADELNNTGSASGVIMASPTLSWNDFDFGTQASEMNNEPSMADSATYQEPGRNNYGGNISHYYPLVNDDFTNPISQVQDLVEIPGALLDIALRIDGATSTNVPATDGDFVSVYRVEGDGEQNPFTPGESKRFTKEYIQKSEFSHYTLVGGLEDAEIIIPSGLAVGDTGRVRVVSQGRDVTNLVTFRIDSPVANLDSKGGSFTVLNSGSAQITVTYWENDEQVLATEDLIIT